MKKTHSDDLFDLFFENSIGLLCIADTNGYFKKLNPEWKKTLGYELSELEGKLFIDFVHPDDVASTIGTTLKLSKNIRVQEFINRYRHKNGSYRWIEWRSYAKDNMIYASARDITERLEIEKELYESEERNRLINSITTDYILKFERDEKNEFLLSYASKKFEKQTGLKQEDIKNYEDRIKLYHPEDLEKVLEHGKKIVSTGKPAEIECRILVNNKLRWLKIISNPIVDLKTKCTTAYFSAIKDITQQKIAEKALIESEEKFSLSFETSPDGISITDFNNGKYIEVNQGYSSLTGYTKEELIERTADEFNLFVKQDEKNNLFKELKEKGICNNIEIKLQCKNGKTIVCLVSASTITLNNNKCILAYVRDITDRKLWEDKLAELNKKLNTIIDTIPIPLFDLDTKGRILSIWNPASEKMFGWKKDEVLGKKLPTIPLNKEDEFNRLISLQRNRKTLTAIDVDRVKKDGTTISYSFFSAPVIDDKGVGNSSIITLIDITERKKMLKEIRENNELINGIAKNIPGIVCQFFIDKNEDFGFNYVSDSSIKYFNIDNKDLNSFFKLFIEKIPEKDRDSFINSINKSVNNNSKWDYKFRYNKPGVGIRYFRGISQPRKDKGKIIFDGILLDITDSKTAEKELSDTKAILTASIYQSPLPLVIISATDMIIRWINDSAADIFLINNLDDYLGKPITSANRHWENIDENLNKLDIKQDPVYQALEGITTQNKVMGIKRSDGSIRWISTSSIPIINANNEIIAAYLIFIDITDKKKSDAILLETKERLQLFMESSTDAMSIWDSEMKLLEINKTGLSFFRKHKKKEIIIGKQIADCLPGYQFSKIKSTHNLVIKSGNPITFEDKIPVANKGYIWYNTRLFKVGKGIGIVSTDITERKDSEEKFKELAALHQTIIDTVTAGIVYIRDRKIQWANNSYFKIFGNSLLEKNNSLPYKHKEDYERIEEEGYDALSKGLVYSTELETIKKDASTIWIQLTGKAIDPKHAHEGSIWLLQDISHRKNYEDALKKHVIALTRPLNDASNIELTDLFNIDELQEIQDSFADATGVASIITHIDGTPITKPSNFCNLCKLIRTTKIGLTNCFKSDAEIGKQNHKGPTIQPCLSGGLWDAGASITIGGVHIANWLIGQVQNEKQDIKKMLNYADEIGIEREIFFKNLKKVPIMQKKQFEKVSRALFILANELSLKAYQNVQQARFIADQKRAEEALKESEEKARLFITNTPLPIAMFDKEMRYILASKRWITDYKLESHTLIGRSHYEVFPEIPDRWKDDHERVLAGEIFRMEADKFERTDGSVQWLRYELHPWHKSNGEIGGLVMFTEDITERIEAEEKIKKMNIDLEQRVIERTSKLMEANEELEAFAYSISHDLRAPLRHIDGFVNLLYKNLQQPNDNISNYYKKINAASSRMSVMIEELLSFSRLGRKEMNFVSVNLTDLIWEIIDHFKPDWENRIVKWKLNKLPHVWSDNSLLRIAFENLISNALKYSSKNTESIIEFGVRSETDLEATLYIKDNGSGFDMKYANKLFGVFQRLHSAEEFEGVGIGLANVKQILKKHNGNIMALSEINKGATFFITLPKKEQNDAL